MVDTPRLAALIAYVLILASAQATSQDMVKPGNEGVLKVPGYAHDSVIYVPSDHQSGLKLPLIFFLHGAGGSPTSWPWRPATGGKGYIVAGLSYAAMSDAGAGGIRGDEKTREAMVEFIDKARATIDELYGVDQRQVFLSGLSMGGWGVNHYGFLERARGRYRGYAIIAAGIAQGANLELSVLDGKPLLLLNGEKDQNLPAANQGKPRFEAAGAIVTQVILPNEGHVPSIESMAPELKKWLEALAREDELSDGVAGVEWHYGEFEGAPAKGLKKDEVLLAFLEKQALLKKAAKERPVLIFCGSNQPGRNGAPSKQAKDTELALNGSLRYPAACATPAAARAFTCFNVDLSKVSKKENALLHKDLAPLVLLIDRDRSSAVLLARGKLKDKPLATELRKLLDEKELAAADQRVAETEPILEEMKKVMKAMASERKALAKLRGKPAGAVAKKLAKHSEALAGHQARFYELRGKLQ